MSWLEELETDYRYRCASGHKSLFRMPASTPEEVKRADAVCPECGLSAPYEGFEPIKTGLRTKVLGEQNGRYYYEIRRPDGSVGRISKTKYDYLESMGKTYDDGEVDKEGKAKLGYAKIRPAYTPAYTEHLKKIGRHDLLEEKLIKDVRKKAPTGASTIKKGEAV